MVRAGAWSALRGMSCTSQPTHRCPAAVTKTQAQNGARPAERRTWRATKLDLNMVYSSARVSFIGSMARSDTCFCSSCFDSCSSRKMRRPGCPNRFLRWRPVDRFDSHWQRQPKATFCGNQAGAAPDGALQLLDAQHLHDSDEVHCVRVAHGPVGVHGDELRGILAQIPAISIHTHDTSATICTGPDILLIC